MTMFEDSGRRCVGVDGARHGWLAVWEQQGELQFNHYADPDSLWSAHCDAAAIAVDIPIGLSDAGPRAPDAAARKFVGGRRHSSIFSAPVRPILDSTTQAEASRRHQAIDGRGLSAQAFAILPKIRMWDDFLATRVDARERVFEIHPEVSFAALNGGTGLTPSKKSVEGEEARTKLLSREFGADRVLKLVSSCPRTVAATDDVLDALAALWTARRIAAGVARTLPANPLPDSMGIKTAIYF